MKNSKTNLPFYFIVDIPRRDDVSVTETDEKTVEEALDEALNEHDLRKSALFSWTRELSEYAYEDLNDYPSASRVILFGKTTYISASDSGAARLKTHPRSRAGVIVFDDNDSCEQHIAEYTDFELGVVRFTLDEWFDQIYTAFYECYIVNMDSENNDDSKRITKTLSHRNRIVSLDVPDVDLRRDIVKQFGADHKRLPVFIEIHQSLVSYGGGIERASIRLVRDGGFLQIRGYDTITVNVVGKIDVSNTMQYLSPGVIPFLKLKGLIFADDINGQHSWSDEKVLVIGAEDGEEVHVTTEERLHTYATWETQGRNNMTVKSHNVEEVVATVVGKSVVSPDVEPLLFSKFRGSKQVIVFNEDIAEKYGVLFDDRERAYGNSESVFQDCNAEYHQMIKKHGFQWKCNKNAKFTIGIEIEKEDEDMRDKHAYRQLFKDTGWVKESDSSLCDDSGFELVSPVFNLMNDSLEESIDNSPELRELINATYNQRVCDEDNYDEHPFNGDYSIGDAIPACGGHINIGSSVYSPIQLFFGLKGFFPLLYTIYDLRLEQEYSKAEKPYNYLESHESGGNNHHTALQIKGSVIEFRIVAAVRNTKNLIWRRDLVRLMCENINKSEGQVISMMTNSRSRLYQHLRKVYKSDERYMKKCNDFIRFAELYNDVKLPKLNQVSLKRNIEGSTDESNNNDNSQEG